MTNLTPSQRNTRLGLRYFYGYAAVYLAYVLVMGFAPEWSERQMFGGLNLALVWGFGLILLAFVLAMAYGVSCQTDSSGSAPAGGSNEEDSR